MALNGVTFVTHHTDYVLNKPHATNKGASATEPIAYPDVPPAVTSAGSLENQVEEMKQWFKAFHDQNTTVRDYRPYFKPVLCYLEGFWSAIQGDDDAVVELGKSGRHQLRAKTWAELNQKTKFMAYSGKITDQFTSLPTKIIDTENRTDLSLAQWNYQVKCHPLSEDLPTDRLKAVDDFSVRMANNQTMAQHMATARLRYKLCPAREGDCSLEGYTSYELIDEIMHEIPGIDGYAGNLQNTVYDQQQLGNDGLPLNAAFYHRQYKSDTKDKMGSFNRRKGFADPNLFLAMTSSEDVAGMSVPHGCKFEDGKITSCEKYFFQRWSYAVPLEIIYLTPLNKWNPLNLQYHGDAASEAGKVATAGGRNGGATATTAFDGTNSENFFQTPASFFAGTEPQSHPRDTVSSSAGVLDADGNVHSVFASGLRVHLPQIAGVGSIRQRYPIAPVFDEGTGVAKEVSAMKGMVTSMVEMNPYFLQSPPIKGNTTLAFALAMPNEDTNTVLHTHQIVLGAEESRKAASGDYVTIESTESTAGDVTHKHNVTLKYDIYEDSYVYSSCDGQIRCEHYTYRLLVV